LCTDINQTKFEALVDKYSGSVYKFCRSLTYSKEDADDLLQETFLRTFEQLPKIIASDNPQGFLFSTASYLWKSWKRKYASFATDEEVRLVRELVDGLPDKLKTPTILYYTLEMNVPDIAKTLELPSGTVKSRLFKARKIIEKGLVEHETG
jgi:RNA polymerase sigma-70 factor (ECF subfamily)